MECTVNLMHAFQRYHFLLYIYGGYYVHSNEVLVIFFILVTVEIYSVSYR